MGTHIFAAAFVADCLGILNFRQSFQVLEMRKIVSLIPTQLLPPFAIGIDLN